MKRAALQAMGCVLLGSSMLEVSAQETPAPPPPESQENPTGESPRRPPGPGFDGRGGPMRGGGGDRERMDFFKQLSEAERQKVRAAFEKAWSKPEVSEARERYMKANDEYRQVLHQALKEADPEVAKLLEKHQPPGLPPMPEPGDPEFAAKSVARLGMELHMLSRGENREFPSPDLHGRLLGTPTVKEAIEALRQAPPEGRVEAWRRLLGAYQSAARAALPPREGRPRDGKDSFGGPGGPSGSGPRREGAQSAPQGDRPPRPGPPP